MHIIDMEVLLCGFVGSCNLETKIKGHIVWYNGRIYNAKELREELKNKGFSFEGTTQEEILSKAYMKWRI